MARVTGTLGYYDQRTDGILVALGDPVEVLWGSPQCGEQAEDDPRRFYSGSRKVPRGTCTAMAFRHRADVWERWQECSLQPC